MNMNEYQALASRTAPKDGNWHMEMANFAMGLSGEAGETTDYLKKVIFHGHEFDSYILEKELGDVLWYVSQLARLAGLSLEDIANTNVKKLMARYPEGFRESDSINRVE